MKRLWQSLLPGTPMPTCGTGKDDGGTQSENDTPLQRAADETTSSRD